MAGKPRKRQSRKTGRRTVRAKRGSWLHLRLPARAGLVATVCLAIVAGAALGYGLGLLNREAPERTTVAVSKPADRQPKPSASSPEVPPPGGTPRVETGRDQPRAAARIIEPAWVRNAVPSADREGAPAIAIVIDDVGLNPAQTRKVAALPAPVTMAFLTYADRLPEQAEGARAAGHELLVHFPMEPTDAGIDPGPNALLANLNEAEIAKRLRWGLSRFEGYVGLNNHMGSRFTTGEAQMGVVLRELKKRGLLFLDSATSPGSVGGRLSRQLGLPHAVRDVFLDNSRERSDIRASLAVLEQRARDHGQAIGIGHPFDETIEEVARWMQDARRRGFALVPLTAIVRRNAAPGSKLGARLQDPAG